MRNPYLDLLQREGDFRRVYIAQLISFAGDWVALVPLLTLLPRLTGQGALWNGLVLAADTLAFAVVAPYAGTVVDRLDRRKLLIAADVVSAVMVLLLLLVDSRSTAWIAVLAMAGLASAKAFSAPAVSAATPNLVSRKDLRIATLLTGATWGTTLAVGAAVGGLLAALTSTRTCFLIDACSFLVSAVLVARTRRPFQGERVPRERAGAIADIREALRYARSHPHVRVLLTAKAGPAMGNGAVALIPLMALELGHPGEAGTGWLFAARGVGALMGPLAIRRVLDRSSDRLWQLLLMAMLAFAGGYALLAAVPVYWLALPVLVVAHAGGGGNWMVSTYALQASVPDAVRGRVFSLDYTAATLFAATSLALVGVLSTQLGPRTMALGVAAVVGTVALAWWTTAARTPVPSLPAHSDDLSPTPPPDTGG